MFDFMLCELVEILDFDSLEVKYCFLCWKGSWKLWILKCYVIEWYVLYMNDENCMKLVSYIWDNVFLFDGTLSMKKAMFNRDSLVSLMI